MKFKTDLLNRYISQAPLALAFERYLECQIYLQLPLAEPILDLGCGEGLFAQVLFDQKIDTGIDPNPRELQRAAQLGGYAELIQCFGDKIPKPDASYKTVFSNSVLEHIPDLDPVLREVNRILEIGGVFYFTVPSDKFDQFSVINRVLTKLGLNTLANKYRAAYNRFWRHYHYYPRSVWAERISDFGFEVIESREYDPQKICTRNDLLAPFGFFLFVLKKLTNQWVVSSTLRGAFFKPFTSAFSRFLLNGEKSESGGLVFVAARKVKAC